jgi:DNA-binding NarL/FixJ family response regulator
MIRVALVEDDAVLRESLAVLIDSEADLSCVGRHGSVEEALAAPTTPPPEVILLDIHLPGMLGSIGVANLCEKYPRATVLMLTVYADQEKVFDSICNGACGYLLKKTPAPKIMAAIREVHAGGAPMSPEIARKVVLQFRRPKAPKGAPLLTPQEVRLLALLADGHSYQNSAGQLDITINTIRNHVRSIYDKLHVHTKSEAVAKAMKQGLIK